MEKTEISPSILYSAIARDTPRWPFQRHDAFNEDDLRVMEALRRGVASAVYEAQRSKLLKPPPRGDRIVSAS